MFARNNNSRRSFDPFGFGSLSSCFFDGGPVIGTKVTCELLDDRFCGCLRDGVRIARYADGPVTSRFGLVGSILEVSGLVGWLGLSRLRLRRSVSHAFVASPRDAGFPLSHFFSVDRCSA